jgi:hypothetical protein
MEFEQSQKPLLTVELLKRSAGKLAVIYLRPLTLIHVFSIRTSTEHERSNLMGMLYNIGIPLLRRQRKGRSVVFITIILSKCIECTQCQYGEQTLFYGICAF